MAKQSTRIKTYYGIPVPPWKHTPIGKSITFVFVLTGRIPSKKNDLIAVVDRTDAFAFMREVPGNTLTKAQCVEMIFKTFGRIKNSPKYEAWETAAVETFKNQLSQNLEKAQSLGITFPLSNATIKVKFYWKDKHRRDNSNKSEGIHDALVKAHILQDDSDQVIPDTAAGARNYSEELAKSLAVAYITVPLP